METKREVWNFIVDSLRQFPIEQSNHRFDVNYDAEILCKTEEDANCLADFFECLGFDMHTSENDVGDDEFSWEVYPG